MFVEGLGLGRGRAAVVVLTLGEWLPQGVATGTAEAQSPISELICGGGGSSPPTPELSIRAGICGDHYCTAVFVRTQVLVIDQFNDPRVKERGLNH